MSHLKMDWIYSPLLHKSLHAGKLDDKAEDGFYLLVLRVNKNEPYSFSYKYIYYPNIFLNSLVAHLVVKEDFSKTFMFRDWGDFLVVFDNNLSNDESLQGVLKESITLNQHWKEFAGNGVQFTEETPQEALDFLKKLSVSTSDISYAISLGIRKELRAFINHFVTIKVPEGDNDIYFIKDCMFVCKDLETVLSKLKDLGFSTRKRNKSQVNVVDSSESFLANLDNDYRNALHKFHLTHIKSGELPSSCLLPKSKFSYRNVHMNLGIVKSYSTSRKSFEGKNRQDLFEDNYQLIQDILKKNFYVGSEKIQKELELFLYNQENLMKDPAAMEKIVNYSKDSLDVLLAKQRDLKDKLNNLDISNVNLKYGSNKYLPIVKEIIGVLGVDKTVDLLISYFMVLLTKETSKWTTDDDEDIETPGIYTIKCYNDFGKRIFDKFMFMKYIKSDIYENKGMLTDFINSIKPDYKIMYGDEDSYALMGAQFVYNLVTLGLLEEKLDKHPENRLHTIHYLRVSEKYRTKFLVNARAYSLPQRLPMVCQPKVYELNEKGMKLGGYMLNDEHYLSSLIKPRIGYKDDTVILDDNLIIDMVNRMMKTPYKINIQTLEYIYKYGIEKGIVIDSSSEDIQKFMSNPYGKHTDKKSKIYRSLISKIIMEKNILSIAETYSRVDKIYFPVRLDFRTRINTRTDYFDYQKGDLAKGLILFATPGQLRKSDHEAILYFKAYGANMYGNGLGKKSLSARAKWVDDNTEKLLNFEVNNIVCEAEEKTCFVSFCFEYTSFVSFMNNKEQVVFNTHLPIQLDATCNGYQHLALLTKEKGLLDKLNLGKSNYNLDPQDFYKHVKDLLSEYVQDEIDWIDTISNKSDEDIKRLEGLKKISKLDFVRDILKAIIMRESYSASIPSLVKNALSNEDIKEHQVDREFYYTYKGSDVKFTRSDMSLYVMSIKEVISRIAPKIKLLSDYLNAIVRICTALEVPVLWRLPHGAEISQSYLASNKKKITPFSFTKSNYTFIKFVSGSYEGGKQRRSLRPNLVHSLDATSIALLYNNISKEVSLYTIHDCFAVTANNVPMLVNKLKLVYIAMYSSTNYLAEFDAMIRLNINTVHGDDKFVVDGNYVYIPDGRKVKLIKGPERKLKNNVEKNAKVNKLKVVDTRQVIEFPNLNDIISLDRSKFKKVEFPNIKTITTPSVDVDISDIKKSVYHIK